jgi:hypothetical protein
MIDPIHFPKLVQKLGIAVVEACDFAELRTVTPFVFYDLAPDFDLAEYQRPIAELYITIVLIRSYHVPEGVNSVRCHITGGWLVGVPDIISHVDAVETVIAAPKPT